MSQMSFTRSTSLKQFLSFHAFITALVIVICLLAYAPLTRGQQRSIINPSFEQPVITDYKFVNEDASAGWNTSHPFFNNCDIGVANCRPLEYWHTGFSSVSTATNAGDQFAELNVAENSMIYQTLCLTNGESFDYSFLHRGRGSATTPDVAQFRLGIPTGLPPGSKPADSYSFDILEVSTTSDGTVTSAPTGNGTINAPVAAGNAWVRYSGNYTYTGTTQLVNIGFAAISSGGGDVGNGNFIDDWRINLTPFVEFATSSLSGDETNGLVANPPSIRIGGTVPSGGVNVTVQVSGGTATIGQDYSLSVPFQSGNTTNTATIFIPAGEYDGASATSIFPITFSLRDENVSEGAETVNFIITAHLGADIDSASSCGAAPLTSLTYNINDPVTTATSVAINGRVISTSGRGVARARVSMTDSAGESRTVQTNLFGYYQFQNVLAGETYVFNVQAKRHNFASAIVAVGSDLTELNFTEQP